MVREVSLLRSDLAAIRAAASRESPALAASCAADAEGANTIAKIIASLSAPPTSRQTSPREKEAPPRTVEQEAALTRANDAFDRVLARGRITAGESDAIRHELTLAASPSDAFELRRRFAQAINLGKLVPDDPHHFVP